MDNKDDESQDFRYEGRLFAERPVFPDVSVPKLIFRYIITFGPAIVLGYWWWWQGMEILHLFLGCALAGIFSAMAFGYDFFGWHVVGLGQWRRRVPDLHRMEYFTWDQRPDILGIRAPNGRRVILQRMFQVTALPTNLRGNFAMFVKQLASSRTPFTYQVVHAPCIDADPPKTRVLPKGLRPRDWRAFQAYSSANWGPASNASGSWVTSVIFSTKVTARGYLLTHWEMRSLRHTLDAHAASLEAAFAANYHHAKLDLLQGASLARAAQGLFPGPVTESPKHNVIRIRPADFLKAGPIVLGLFLTWTFVATSLAPFLAGTIFSISAFFTVASAIPALWPVLLGGGTTTYYNPWAGQAFFCLRHRIQTARGVLCVRATTRRASFGGLIVFGHIALQGYADPAKWLRSVQATQTPVLYQWEVKPVDFSTFRKVARKSFASDMVSERAKRETAADQETFMSYWGGFWLASGIIGTRHDYDLPDLATPGTFEAPRKAGLQQLRALGAITLNAFRDCGLVRLRAQHMRVGLCMASALSAAGWESGSGICQFLVAGNSLAPYTQLVPDLKRGIETCIPAEFNTPTNLENYIVLGAALNTEVLKEEGPAGFSEQCLSSSVVVLGGSPHERSAAIQKVAVELLAKGEGGIALDSSGAWTGLARATKDTALWAKITVQVAGQDFWADPFALAKTEPGYAAVFCDALALIYNWQTTQRDFLYQSMSQVEEGSLEMTAVAHALEMVLAERSKLQGDAVLSAVNTLTAGHNALFFRSGALNLPAGAWAKANCLVILDFSPLPEPQQSVARIAVYLYLALLAQAGHVSTRVYFDDVERIVTRQRYPNVHFQKFNAHFSLGNLPVVAGVGRPSDLLTAFLELFDAAICLQMRNKVDLKTIAELMAMDDRAEGGMYSETRKSTYQLEFVQQLRPGWAVVKRSDRPEPFPIALHLDPIARLPPIAPASARAESAPLQSPPVTEGGVNPNAPPPITLIEHDLGSLSGFAAEALDFLQVAASAQEINGGPVSHKLLADQLLYKLQPAAFRFKLSDRGAADVRNRLLDALAAADYLRATYRKDPGGEERGATCYEVTPKHLEARSDAVARGSDALRAKVTHQGGNLAGVTFTEPKVVTVVPGELDRAFARSFLPGLAAARVALMAGQFADAAIKAEHACARFLATALGRTPEDVDNFDADSLALALTAFPEWPFDLAESRAIWASFKPGSWNGLDEAELTQRLNELTAFHEAFQMRGTNLT